MQASQGFRCRHFFWLRRVISAVQRPPLRRLQLQATPASPPPSCTAQPAGHRRRLSELAPTTRDCAESFLRLVLEKNRVLNLTAVQDWEEAKTLHLEDSLSLLEVIKRLSQCSFKPAILDVGSGAGFPGVILAIAEPKWQVTLLDSVRKKCNFLRESMHALQLGNVATVWSRAETLARSEDHREKYDFVVARAVAQLNVLAELCLPFVQLGGYWIAMKGPSPQVEVEAATAAIQKLGGSLIEIKVLDLCGNLQQRTAVIVQKSAHTNEAYPREEGIPKKHPL